MATRTNWARMTVSSGGTGTLTLAAIANTPTFAQAHGSGNTTIDYTIVYESTGVFETGTAVYNGTANTLSSRTVTQSYASGTYGTSAVNVPTGAYVINAPTIQTVADLDSVQTLANKTLTTPTIASFANATHTHTNSAGGGTLDAAAIGSGVIAVARLGTGTPSASTMLTGDGAWTTVPSISNLGTAAYEDIDYFAEASHVHTPGEVGIDVTTATEGQIIAVQSDGSLAAETPTLAAFASDGLAPVNGSTLYGEGGAWVTKTLQQILTAANKDKIAITFAIPEITSGNFPICPYVPAGAAGTITDCYVITDSGTQQIAIKIGGTTVTGLSALNVSSTRNSASATALNTIALGNTISGTVNSGSSPVRGMGVLLVTTAV